MRLMKRIRPGVAFLFVVVALYPYTALADWTGVAMTSQGSIRVGSSSGGGGGGGSDKNPPRISNVSSSGITTVTADIYWETHEKSTSQVEYWASVPKFSELDEELVRNHHVQLIDLLPGTSYSYRTLSQDRAGNLATSEGFVFATLEEAPTEPEPRFVELSAPPPAPEPIPVPLPPILEPPSGAVSWWWVAVALFLALAAVGLAWHRMLLREREKGERGA